MSVVVFPQSLRAFEIKSVWAGRAALLLDAHQASTSSPAAWGRSVLSHRIIFLSSDGKNVFLSKCSTGARWRLGVGAMDKVRREAESNDIKTAVVYSQWHELQVIKSLELSIVKAQLLRQKANMCTL